MEVRITLSGIGMTIPKIGIGLNGISACYLEVKREKGNNPIKVYGITDVLSVGPGSGSLIFGHAQTNWMTISDPKLMHMLTMQHLIGKTVEVEIKGTALGNSKGDVTMKLFDKTGNAVTVIDKFNIPMDAIQLASTKVRGVVKILHAQKVA